MAISSKLRNLTTTCIVLFCTLGSAFAADVSRVFYLSPSGDDANPGTLAKPFQTLPCARDAARAVSREMTGDIVVYLRGGTHLVTAPVEFTAADSGRNGFDIIYRSYREETPIISGGVTVTDWSVHNGRIYKATLRSDAKLRPLYVKGTRAEMTRADFLGKGAWGEFVVKGDEPWAETPGTTLDGIKFDSAELPALTNPADIELLQRRIWTFLVMGIRDVAVEDGFMVAKLQQPLGAIAATMAWDCNIAPQEPFTLRNAFEFLNRPGQFYFNRVTHTLYYFARDVEDMAKAEVVAPTSEGLLRIAGSSTSERVKNLVFSGLTFSHDHWQLNRVADSHGAIGVQSLGYYTHFRADGDHHKTHYNILDLPQATVELRNAENIRFERNHFTRLASGCAISLVNDVVDSAVVGNVFNDLSGNAVNVGHPQHYKIGDGPLFPAGVEGVCARDKISNNWIREVSREFKQQEAISGFFTEAVEISHNDIARVPYGGIALGWWWGNAEIPPSNVSKNNVIARNRVCDTQQELSKDGGAIYVLGEQPGSRIENNHVRSNTRTLYLDDGSAYWTVTGNVLDPRDQRDVPKRAHGQWLNLWTPRIHDLKIDGNFTTFAKADIRGVNCVPTNTRVETEHSAEAQIIIDAAGLEPAYRDIEKKASK